MRLGSAFLVGCVLSAACGSAPDGGAATRVDSAGIAIVTGPAVDRPLAATFEPDVVFGGEESGEASFYQVGGENVGVDAEGRIHVLDRAAFRVVVFSPDGEVLWTAGAEGDGPGELGFPSSMAVAPDGTALVLDFTKPGLIRYRDGDALDPWPAAFGRMSGTVRWGGDAPIVERMIPDTAGTVRALDRITASGDSVPIHRFHGEGARPVTFESCGISITAMGPIFEPSLPWDAGPAGVAFAPGAGYEVRWTGTDGVERWIRRGLEPRPADREAALAQVGEGMRIGIGGGQARVCAAEEVVDQRGVADVVPWIDGVALAPDGSLWVRRFAIEDGTEGPIDLFDPAGEYRGTLPPETRIPLAWLPDGRVVLREYDETTEIARIAVGTLTIGEPSR